MPDSPQRSAVLCLSGLDPSGGAGIQADIETLQSLGCHCLPVVTCLTVQNSRDVFQIENVAPRTLLAQARTVLADIDARCIKIGLIGSIEGIEVVRELLHEYPTIPVVLDPILRAGGGFDLGGEEIAEALRERLLPLCTLVTPNTHEAALIAGVGSEPASWAQAIVDLGCPYAAITGTHENEAAGSSDRVANRLFGRAGLLAEEACERLPYSYHGSGCTFAAAIAAGLATGLATRDTLSRGDAQSDAMVDAFRHAQAFTYASLVKAQQLGAGQWLPSRAPLARTRGEGDAHL